MKNRKPLIVGLGSLVAAGAVGGILALGLSGSVPAAVKAPKVQIVQRSDAAAPTTTVPAVTPTTAPQTSAQAPVSAAQTPTVAPSSTALAAASPAPAQPATQTPVTVAPTVTTTVATDPLAPYSGQYTTSSDCPAGTYIIVGGSPIYGSGLVTVVEPVPGNPGDFCVTLNQ